MSLFNLFDSLYNYYRYGPLPAPQYLVVNEIPPLPKAKVRIAPVLTEVETLKLRYRTHRDGNACYQVYTAYHKGSRGVNKDVTIANLWLARAAALGHFQATQKLKRARIAPLCMVSPRECFQKYKIFLRFNDDREALNWLDRAVMLNHPKALYAKGIMLKDGMKYKKNPRHGDEYLKKAKEFGFKT